MKKLLAWIVAVGVAFVAFRMRDTPGTDPLDAFIIGEIGITFLVIGIVMIIMTRNWTARGLGIVSAILGTSVLYTGSLIIYLEPGAARWSELLSDMVRALLFVGGPLLLIGVVRYLNSAIFPEGDAGDYSRREQDSRS